METKLNLTRDKSTHSPIKGNVLQHKINTKKTKARFSRLLGVVKVDINKQTTYRASQSEMRRRPGSQKKSVGSVRVSDKSADFVRSGPVRVVEFGTGRARLCR